MRDKLEQPIWTIQCEVVKVERQTLFKGLAQVPVVTVFQDRDWVIYDAPQGKFIHLRKHLWHLVSLGRFIDVVNEIACVKLGLILNVDSHEAIDQEADKFNPD